VKVTVCNALQVVFRKIADVLREKELAERDLTEPPIELSTDHPVRRLISRFRKMSCSRLPSVGAGLQLAELSASDTLTVERSLHHALAAPSIDATNCRTTDVTDTTYVTDTTNNNCTPISNGRGAASAGQSARRRMLSADVTAAAAAAAAALPSNSVNTRSASKSEAGDCEERVLLCDNMVPCVTAWCRVTTWYRVTTGCCVTTWCRVTAWYRV